MERRGYQYESPTAPHARNPNPTYTRTPNETQLTKKVEAKLADGDIHGALRLLTSEDTIAPHILALAKTHPPHPTPTTFPSIPAEPIEVLEAEEKKLKTITATSPSEPVGGIGGIRPQILKDLLTVKEEEIHERLTKALLYFINMLLRSTTNTVIRPILFGENLTALKKKTGGIRPIAVGITFRRMAAKVVCQRIKKPITNELVAHQLGVGISGQGDPLGPAILALVIQPIVHAIQAELNLWYWNDANIGNSPEVVLADLDVVQKMTTKMELTLNSSKCEMAIVGARSVDEKQSVIKLFKKRAPGITVMQEENIQLLRVPLKDEALDAILQTKTEALDITTKRLVLLTRHSAFFLLRASISIPRLIYFLRYSPTWRKASLLEKYDATLKSSLEAIVNISQSRDAWLQSSLQVKMDGLGIRHSANMVTPCFITSLNSSLFYLESLLPADILLNTTTIIAEAQKFWETSCHAEEVPSGPVCCIQSV
ncbi:hypothetical protein ILUMI_24745 [Ignelater luminosus]|uniref:Reverse transcriptase domain-containing protein n=1 Tax=Ignelater luminosus TaxID=2038154 RepID=A0A8K0C6J4_IGNLU|nr:hypothetical protein ILUMI_24745 [Ignelater luminosus]